MLIDDLYACLELFCRLVMLRTGYDGKMTLYSKHVWLNEKLGTLS